MKIDISVDIDELMANILKDQNLFQFMMEELATKTKTLMNKEEITMNDIFNNIDNKINNNDDVINEPAVSIIVAPMKKKRGRPRKSTSNRSNLTPV
jgi:hypothetical protein